MSARYEALATKARAMFGQRLRAADLERLSQLDGTRQVLEELRQHSSWAPAVQALPEGEVPTRARLEDALRSQLRQEQLRLISFIPQEDWALMDFPILRAELERILNALRRLHASMAKPPELLPQAYLAKARVNLEGLRQCKDFSALVEATQGSIYYNALQRLRQGDQLPDYGMTEALLWSVYYRHMIRLIRRRYSGDTRRLLEQSVGSQADMLNIMHILRLKRYFPQEDNYLPVLLPFHYRVSPGQIHAMCSATTPQGVLELVEGTPYAAAFRGVSPEKLHDRYAAVLYQLSRRQLRMGKPSVYTAVAYLNLREVELRMLVSAVEAAKYRQSLDPSLLRVLAD